MNFLKPIVLNFKVENCSLKKSLKLIFHQVQWNLKSILTWRQVICCESLLKKIYWAGISITLCSNISNLFHGLKNTLKTFAITHSSTWLDSTIWAILFQSILWIDVLFISALILFSWIDVLHTQEIIEKHKFLRDPTSERSQTRKIRKIGNEIFFDDKMCFLTWTDWYSACGELRAETERASKKVGVHLKGKQDVGIK